MAPNPVLFPVLTDPVWMPTEITMRRVSDLRPYDRNSRTHSEEQLAQVARSIASFGWTVPILTKDGMIVAGHARLEAAKRLGLDQVPTIDAAVMTSTQVRAYVIADNRLAELAGWDFEVLHGELADLAGEGFDISLVGFTNDELERMLGGTPEGSGGLTDEDAIPDPPAEPTTRRGNLWTLGNHRLLCGDAGSVEDLDRLLDGAPVHLVNMDPPYNVRVEPRSNNAMAAAGKGRTQPGKTGGTNRQLRAKDRPLLNDFLTESDFDQILLAWFGNAARVLLPGRGFFVWGGYTNCSNYPRPMQAVGLYFSQAIIWVKEHPVLTHKDFMGNHEWCFYGWREGAAHQYFGPHNATDTWSVKKVAPNAMVHLTEKPVELARRAIDYSTQVGEHVLDLFGGSGSTLIASERLGRRAFLMELDPPYCDVIVQRWQEFTGGSATLPDGRTFQEVSDERAGASAG